MLFKLIPNGSEFINRFETTLNPFEDLLHQKLFSEKEKKWTRIGIGRVAQNSDEFLTSGKLQFYDQYCRESNRFISVRFINERSTLTSVNMVAVGIFIGANIIFIVGFAVLFVCQKRILTKASFPN